MKNFLSVDPMSSTDFQYPLSFETCDYFDRLPGAMGPVIPKHILEPGFEIPKSVMNADYLCIKVVPGVLGVKKYKKHFLKVTLDPVSLGLRDQGSEIYLLLPLAFGGTEQYFKTLRPLAWFDVGAGREAIAHLDSEGRIKNPQAAKIFYEELPKYGNVKMKKPPVGLDHITDMKPQEFQKLQVKLFNGFIEKLETLVKDIYAVIPGWEKLSSAFHEISFETMEKSQLFLIAGGHQAFWDLLIRGFRHYTGIFASVEPMGPDYWAHPKWAKDLWRPFRTRAAKSKGFKDFPDYQNFRNGVVSATFFLDDHKDTNRGILYVAAGQPITCPDGYWGSEDGIITKDYIERFMVQIEFRPTEHFKTRDGVGITEIPVKTFDLRDYFDAFKPYEFDLIRDYQNKRTYPDDVPAVVSLDFFWDLCVTWGLTAVNANHLIRGLKVKVDNDKNKILPSKYFLAKPHKTKKGGIKRKKDGGTDSWDVRLHRHYRVQLMAEFTKVAFTKGHHAIAGIRDMEPEERILIGLMARCPRLKHFKLKDLKRAFDQNKFPQNPYKNKKKWQDLVKDFKERLEGSSDLRWVIANLPEPEEALMPINK